MSLYNYQTCDGCSCGLPSINTPDNVDSSCSLNSIRQTFLEIIDAIKNTADLNFSVDIEITTKNGVVSTVNFSKLNINNIILTETTLIADGIAISLCEVVKINIISSPILNTAFPATILNSIKNITLTSYYPNDKYYKSSSCESCNSSKDVKCAQGMQNYINKNMGAIQTVGYTGGVSEIKDITAVGGITTIDIVENATINSTTTPVLSTASLDTQTTPVLNNATVSSQTIPVLDSASLNTQTTSVLKTVTPAQNQVVSNVNLDNSTLLSAVVPTNVEVSAPLNAVPVSVASDVSLTTEDSFVEGIQTTQQQVVTEVTPTTGTAITSIPNGTAVTGVVSGITTPQKLTPQSVNIPTLTSAGTGVLTITIAAKSIDGTNPVSPITLNVKAGNQDVTFGGNTPRFVLPAATDVLGITAGTPVSSTVNQIGVPTTDTFVKTLQPVTQEVIKTVTPQNVTGKLVTAVDKTNINNIDTPTTKNVVESIAQTTQTVNTVTTVDKIDTTNLFETTTENVLSSATLNTTTENVVSSTTLNKTTENVLSSVNLSTTNENVLETSSITLNKAPVINSLQETTTTVFAPVKEDINGRIFAAGDGIMAVNNTNGDISVYSICDINTVTS